LLALQLWSPAVWPALLALVLPHPGSLAAFGVAGLVSAIVGGIPDVAPITLLAPGIAPTARWGLLGIGAVALWLAYETAWRERTGRTRTAPRIALGLALLGLLSLLPLVAGLAADSTLRLHAAAREQSAGAILLLAAAGALLVVPRRWAPVAAGAAALLATLPLALGTQSFGNRFVHDPFFVAERPAAYPTSGLRLIAEAPLPALSGQLGLSPSGASWVIRAVDYGGAGLPPRSRLIVGSAAGVQHEWSANDIVLVDDSRLLALREDGAGLAVEMRAHDPQTPAVWRVDLESLAANARLMADGRSGRWGVVGMNERSGDVVRVSGKMDGSSLVEQWQPGREVAVWLVGAGPAVLGVDLRTADFDAELIDTDDESPLLWWWLTGVGRVGPGTRLLSLDAAGPRLLYESDLFVQCDEPHVDATEILCRASDGVRTSFWRIDPANGARRNVALLNGLGWSARPEPDGWLVLVQAGSRQLLYRLGSNEVAQLDTGDGPPWIHAVAGFDGGIGTIVSGTGGQPRLHRYAVP
jgi:hypothetical protein